MRVRDSGIASSRQCPDFETLYTPTGGEGLGSILSGDSGRHGAVTWDREGWRKGHVDFTLPSAGGPPPRAYGSSATRETCSLAGSCRAVTGPGFRVESRRARAPCGSGAPVALHVRVSTNSRCEE